MQKSNQPTRREFLGSLLAATVTAAGLPVVNASVAAQQSEANHATADVMELKPGEVRVIGTNPTIVAFITRGQRCEVELDPHYCANVPSFADLDNVSFGVNGLAFSPGRITSPPGVYPVVYVHGPIFGRFRFPTEHEWHNGAAAKAQRAAIGRRSSQEASEE